MTGWNEGIASAIAYIEAHLDTELNIEDIAEKACVSSFHFQRIFNVLCGFTVGEYIRNRRLTLAAQELASSDVKVIDVALKYGYESPDSFARAFTRFHGVTPSAAKQKGSKLNAFAPLKIVLKLEGATLLEYKIVEKEQFTVVGKLRQFHADTSYTEIPVFWEEHLKNGGNETICGMYGICMGIDEKNFEYLIADNYIPWEEVPEGCVTRVIPAGTWAIFPHRGAWQKSFQALNTRIWSEWLPSCKSYKLAGNYNIELYTPPCENPEDNYAEIWVPVEKL